MLKSEFGNEGKRLLLRFAYTMMVKNNSVISDGDVIVTEITVTAVTINYISSSEKLLYSIS